MDIAGNKITGVYQTSIVPLQALTHRQLRHQTCDKNKRVRLNDSQISILSVNGLKSHISKR